MRHRVETPKRLVVAVSSCCQILSADDQPKADAGRDTVAGCPHLNDGDVGKATRREELLSTGDESTVDEDDGMGSVIAVEASLGRGEAVVSHACRPAVVDGVWMLMMWQPFQPLPLGCGERIDDSGEPKMTRAVQYRQLTDQRPQEPPRGRHIAINGDCGEFLERDCNG